MGRREGSSLVKCALLAALAVFAPPGARAGTPASVAVAAHFTQTGDHAELVFDLSRSVEARAYALERPDRIVIDLPDVNFQIDAAVGRTTGEGDNGLVRAYRFGLLDTGRSRIVLDLTRPACPDAIESRPIAEGAPASRLRISLKSCAATDFAALERSPTSSPIDAPAPPPTPPVIVLDPGHGGVDGGAHGIGGVAEKTLVLEFCNELQRQLELGGKYTVVMTRKGDEYVDLDARVDIARKVNAALFVSVHADTLSESASVSGSTVYTVSERASDAEAARIAARENAADGGEKAAKRQQDPGVTDILFDLRRRETRAYAHIFSRGLVGTLGGVTRLNHNPERSASFVVLKAPEFPSVLVELGYLSNPEDVRALQSPEWRTKTASAMVRAIAAFFAASTRSGEANPQGVALDARLDGSPNH